TAKSTTQTAGTSGAPGSPIVGIPFFNASTGKEDFSFFGGNLPGRIPIAVANSTVLRLSNLLQGGELNMVRSWVRADTLNITALAGFRYVHFREDLDFGTNSTAPAIPLAVTRLDQFHANNNFYGGNLGLRGDYVFGRFFVQATGKVALGSMHQVMD